MPPRTDVRTPLRNGRPASAGHGPRRPRPRPPRPSLPPGAALAAEALFGAISVLRRSRSLHPDGIAFEATLSGLGGPEAAGVPLFAGGERRALVRLSRGVGLPRGLPDVLGLAIRIPDAHGPGADQDFLLVTSGDAPLAHHLLLPARSFFSLPYSSVLVYRIGGRLRLVGAEPDAPGAGSGLDGAADAAARGEARFRIGVAPLLGTLRPVGWLELGRRLPEREQRNLRFDPWNAGGGIVPTGPFMGLRAPAYRGSREGWPEG